MALCITEVLALKTNILDVSKYISGPIRYMEQDELDAETLRTPPIYRYQNVAASEAGIIHLMRIKPELWR